MNQLEPDSLVRQFLAHPPAGFSAAMSPEGAPTFTAPFDLLTTADAATRQRVQNWPLHRLWRRWLRPPTRFVGTTVSEYAWLPDTTEPDQLAQSLRTTQGRDCLLLVVKDVPQASPLLSPVANVYAADFLAACEREGFVVLEGQALAWVPIDFDSVDEYLARLSRSRRRNLRRKLRARASLDVEIVHTGDAVFESPGTVAVFYALYLRVYEQSELQFDLLSPAFFSAVLREAHGGVVFVYRAGGRMIGWNLCFEHAGMLVDKYIGLDYPAAHEHSLYAVSWFENLEYARSRGLDCYVAGWTDPQVKLQLGARLTFTRHAVFLRNPLLRWLLRRLARHFESDRTWMEEHLGDTPGHP